MTSTPVPEMMPVLSRGKHRSPRKGACFMELASYLAGEPWSDHPRCTHPLLAALAREVNDHVHDRSRARLAPLVPEVIGLTGPEPRLSAWIAREAALTALPVVAAERQNLAAVALLLCERELAGLGDPPDPLTRRALDDVPHARDWARAFLGQSWAPADFARRSAPAIVHKSVSGIAAACVPDPDDLLVSLLARTVTQCRAWLDRPPVEASAEQWHELYQLTHR